MIIDCHAHVFMHWITPTGHPTREIHKRYMQRMITRTVANTFRARDGAKADTKALYRPDDPGWTGLTDVDFRVGDALQKHRLEEVFRLHREHGS